MPKQEEPSTPTTTTTTINVLWSTANCPTGGRRSFPVASDPSFTRFAYDSGPANYGHLFRRQAAVSTYQHGVPGARRCPYSAGWIIPDSDIACNPVFVAHSTLSAIWLLRETLINQDVPDTVWSHLVRAANQLAGPDTLPLPSAQPAPSAQLVVAACALDAERRKRPSSSAEPSTPKRPCLTIAHSPETDDASPAASHASPAATATNASPRSSPVDDGSPSPQSAAPITTVTVTHHNRRAEQKREKKRQLAKIKRLAGLGLVAPTDSSPSELLAFKNVQPQDVEHFSWTFKQKWQQDNASEHLGNNNLYHACKAPYTTTTLLLDRARILGNPTSRVYAARFLQSWRETGSPFHTHAQRPQPPSSAVTQASSSLRPEGLVAQAACFAWGMVQHIDKIMARVHIQHRWAAALLAKAYKDKIAEIHAEEQNSNDRSHNRYGKGRVDTQARKWLMHVLGIENNDQVKARFKKRLDKARRWYTLVQGLGWGILMFMPDEGIPHTWIEKEATMPLLRIWIDLVKKVNPTVYAASVAFEQWLGEDCISGATITSKQMLSIEVEASQAIYEVEVGDSEEEEEENSDGDSSGVEAPRRTRLPALRQMTLLELFKPNE